MKRRACNGWRTGLTAMLLGAVAAPVWAHHSVTAMYDLEKILTLAGTVQRLQLGSPHSHLTVTVPGQRGRSSIWEVELPSLTFLQRAGWNEQTLKPGDRITLTGSPSRYSNAQLYVRSVTRADGTALALLPTSRLPVPH